MKALIIVSMIAGVGLVQAALLAIAGWIVVCAVNLFVEPNYAFGFWAYALVGLVIAMISSTARSRG